MASSDMSLASEHVQRLLQCAVCLERFNQPKLLPCQHTFCLRPCLEGLVDHRTRSIRCPECRADHFVPRNGVSSYPNNLTVIGFLELSQPPARDSVSPSWRPASTSDDVRDGAGSHQPQRAASPPLAPVDGAGADGGGCYVCHREGGITRCHHCDHLVCDLCHQAHSDQVKAELTRLISQVRRGLPNITDQIVIIGRKGTQLQNNCDRVKADVTDAMEKHIRELRARERTLREDIDTFLAGELRTMRNHQENAEVEMASLSSFCDSAETVLSMNRRTPNGDLMEMKRQGEEHLETVICYEDGTIRPPNLKQVQASLESPFLSSTISNFGDLIITSRNNNPLTMTPRDGGTPRTEGGNGNSRASVPAQQREEMPVLLHPGFSRPARASSHAPNAGSPVTRRRDQEVSPSFTARAAQVMFAEGTPTSEDIASPRWSRRSATRDTHTHRRSREERRSDTRISNIMSGRSQTLSQQMRDRTRHLSLGALPVSAEYSEEDSPEREESPGRGAAQDEIDEHEESPEDELAATFPGARARSVFPPSVRFDIGLSAPQSRDTDTMGVLVGPHSPSVYVNSPRNRYNQKGTAVITVGERGSDPSCFTWPRGVAVSPLTDNVIVADSSNHRVQIFDSTGRFLKTFGTYGQDDGEFDCLAGIAVNGLGQIIIADRYNHRIQILDRNGAFRNSFGSEGCGEGQLNYPWGVACDSMGFIYVCDKENHRVQVFQFNGTFVRKFGHLGSRDGQFENPHYVAVSPDNKVYVSDSSNHRIQVFTLYGDFLFSFGTCGTLRGQFKFPRGIAIDNQGFVVVADSGNNRVQIFRADGRFYSMFGGWGSESGQFKGLEGLAILANGNIVVSDRENHRVQIF